MKERSHIGNRRRTDQKTIGSIGAILLGFVIAGALLLSASSSRASIVEIDLTGYITGLKWTKNPFGIDLDTEVFGRASFDNTLLGPDATILSYWQKEDHKNQMALDFYLGSFSFSTAMDSFLNLTFGFSERNLTSIALNGGRGTKNWGLDITYDFPEGTNIFALSGPLGRTRVTGEIAPVPEPGTLLLLGGGLLGLAGIRRSRTKRS